MRPLKVEEVRPGNTIFDGGKVIRVISVDRNPPLCMHHVHVNGALCWNRGDVVVVNDN